MAERLFTDPEMRAAYRALMRDAPDGHLDEATWDRLAGGELDEAGRGAAFDHITACERCAQIWHGVVALQEEAAAQGLIERHEATAPARWLGRRSAGEGGWPSWLVPFAAAALVILALGAVFLTRSQAPQPDVMRTGSGLASIEALMVAYTPDGVPAFVWAPVADATRYRVEVFTDDGRPVWSREADRPPAPWPADVPRSPGTYRWRVEALKDGATIARSSIATAEMTR